MSAEAISDSVREQLSFKQDGGSFRDRANRVYDDGTHIIRGVNAEALRNWMGVSDARFFRELIARGKVIATELLPGSKQDQAGAPATWAAYLSHHRIPFVSYPYEWSFGMLKDAALLHLEILESAIPAGWTLKDATAYNVQFEGSKPVFIDVPSFAPRIEGEPWVGYRQFCMMFLYPLMFRAYRGIDYSPFLRSSLDGIDPQTANQILSGTTKFRKGVFGHVFLHSKLEARFTSQDMDHARSLTEQSGEGVKERNLGRHTEAMIMGTIQGLRRTVERLRAPEERTAWGSYDTDHSYAEASHAAKKAFVERVVGQRRCEMTWDIGCNTGTFSRIAATNSDYVIAIDGDARAIERLYQDQKLAGATDILSLIMNLGNASPDQGWRGKERKSLDKRAKPDLILCLALLHHIVISANIPLEEFVDWLRAFDAELVLEWVGLEDDMTRMLLRNRANQYSELEPANFERVVSDRFAIVDSEPLKGGTRRIYHLRPN